MQGTETNTSDQQSFEEDTEVYLGVSETLMRCPVLIDNTSSSALIDSGCSCSIINETLHRDLALTLEPSKLIVHGLGGEAVHPLGVVELSFRLGDIEFQHEFQVVPSHITNHPMILGNQFFKRYGMSVDTHGKKLSGSSDWGSWEWYTGDSFGPAGFTVLRDIKLIVEEDIEICYGSFSLVTVSFPLGVHPSPDQKLYFDGILDSPYLLSLIHI